MSPYGTRIIAALSPAARKPGAGPGAARRAPGYGEAMVARAKRTAVVATAAALLSVTLAACGGSGGAGNEREASIGPDGQRTIEWVLMGTRRGHALIVRPRLAQRRCETYRARLTESEETVSVHMLGDDSRCTQKELAAPAKPSPDGLPFFVALQLDGLLRGRTVSGPAMAPLDDWQGGQSIGASEEYPRAVPDLTGLSIPQAKRLASAYQATVTVHGSVRGRAWVFRQWPRPGAADQVMAGDIHVRTITGTPPMDRFYG